MSDMNTIFPEDQVQVQEEKKKKTPATRTETDKKEKMPTDIFHQLQYIQQQLKVGKNNINHQLNAAMRDDSFPYRTLEDIYSELKPILAQIDCVLTTQVRPVPIKDFMFTEAVVVLENAKGEKRETTASTMMNLTCGTNKFPSQESAACGTMAIKSALGALFLLDNTTKEQQAGMVVTEIDSRIQPGHTTKPAVQNNTQAPRNTAPAATSPMQENKAPTTTAPKQPAQAGAPAPARKPTPVAAAGGTAPKQPEQASAERKVPASVSEQNEAKQEWKKPELKEETREWQRLGLNASTKFRGTREELIADLKNRFTVDDRTAEKFADSFYNEQTNAAA